MIKYTCTVEMEKQTWWKKDVYIDELKKNETKYLLTVGLALHTPTEEDANQVEIICV